ncbi:MAG: DNA-binding protein [Sulfurimonas sp.]|nr:DNA-binding protein [Sulfurimonas sp.]MBU3938473.1 DNA-binding protein [bacterium]MBU4025446.1 DNA-binding protein [bacterium]MBU4059218.1 DNA-binding protein [bacterium]MBU4110659.1 DNA-binding protein [bacterium]
MSKMSVADAAEYFGVSKEAIHNRIRRGSLESVLEGDIKMVLVGAKPTVSSRAQSKKPAANFANDKYYQFLEEQNSKLQEKVEKLEGETRTLRDQKEQMLIEERIKIEQIYRDKDEQLKSILSTFQAQFMLSPKQAKKEEDDTALDAEIEDIPSENNTISLHKYLKEQEFSKKRMKKIKSRFQSRAENDNRILSVGKKYYIDTSKYDYSDLLE